MRRAVTICAIGIAAMLAVTTAGCPSVSTRAKRTTITHASLYIHRHALNKLVRAEIAAGRNRSAFYVLEVRKTRSYAGQRLVAREPRKGGAVKRDLRAAFAHFMRVSTEGGTRALIRRNRPRASFKTDRTVRDAMFWRDLELFEKRMTAGVAYRHLVNHHFAIASFEEARLLFAPSEALLSFFISGEEIYGFWLRRGRLSVRRIGASTTALRARVNDLVRSVHMPPSASQPAAKQNAWRKPAAAVFHDLLGPFAAELRDSSLTTLFVSPDSFLANVPYAALVDTGSAKSVLVERMRVMIVPSATAYRKILQRHVLHDPPRMLVIGNPVYPAGIPALPFAEREATTVGDVFGGAVVLIGANATEQAIVNAASTHNILHFATHAALLGKFVPGASSLLVTASSPDDGLLSADEIAALDLSRTYLVVLSACETSVGESEGASVDLGTLTGAFLSAGAPSVIGTLWQVADESTTLLMVDFYEQFLELGAGESLRRAQLSLARSARFGHPYYWAAFVLHGWDK